MKKLFLLFFASILITSCDNDLLDPYTPGALTEEVAVKNSTDLQKVMVASYNYLTSRTESVFTSVFTDEVGIGYANGGQGTSEEYIFFINPSSTDVDGIWSTCYYSLSRANRVIEFADRIVPRDAVDAQIIARTKAEALTIRALCHIKLISYFSTDPKNDGALAGVLADRVIEAGETLPRATNGAFYALIQSDLDAAIAIFNVNTAPAYTGTLANVATYYANKNLAKAMKARAYALKGDYANAEIWANDVIASGVQLASPTDYTKVFWTDNEPANTEVIFRLKRTGNQNSQATNLHNGWASVRPNYAGSPFYEVGRALHNLLNPASLPANTLATVSDIRARTIIAPTSLIDPNYTSSLNYGLTDRLILHKHGGVGTGSATFASTATNGNNNDIKVCRISEMYFIIAEARTQAGDLAGASAALAFVINARNVVDPPASVFATATQAWAEILKQRRLEFAFEGYRFIDLKRLGVLAGAGLDRDAEDYSDPSSNYPGGNPANLPLSSYKFALPIPQSELSANSGIQQNPGY